MRTAQRYYIVTDDGSVRRLAVATFYELILRRAPTPFADLAGKRVRLAQITVQLQGRKATAVCHASFGYLTFDDRGFFDSTEWDAAAAATIGSWPAPTANESPSLIDARARFVDRRLEHEHHWQPNDELRWLLFRKAIGRNARPSTED